MPAPQRKTANSAAKKRFHSAEAHAPKPNPEAHADICIPHVGNVAIFGTKRFVHDAIAANNTLLD